MATIQDRAAAEAAGAGGRPFLRAEWRNVLNVTYACPEELLVPHLPAGAEIDTLDGAPRVSFVAFDFERTRVHGLRIPGHVRFPEINLRFYVRHGGRRGVVFIRELVPLRAVAAIARRHYNEPYRRVPMKSARSFDAKAQEIRLTHFFGESSILGARAAAMAHTPADGTAEHWLTHHELGVGRRPDGKTMLYLVRHPVWALHEVTALDMDVDFAGDFGPEWGWLADATPSHVSLAAGSRISVSQPIAA